MATNGATNTINIFQSLTSMIVTPTFNVINACHKVPKQSASSVLTTLAGGSHRLLALFLSVKDYTQLTGAVYIEPINLGQRPIIPIRTTRVAQENISSQYKNNAKVW